MDFVNQLKHSPACNSPLWRYHLVHTVYRSFSFLTVILNNPGWHTESVLRTNPAEPFQNHHTFAVPYSIKCFAKTSCNCTGHMTDVLNGAFALMLTISLLSNVSILAWTSEWPRESRGSAMGWVDCFRLPAVKTVVMGSTSLHCEPGEPILLRNGFQGPSNVTAGGWDILAPAYEELHERRSLVL